MSEEPWEEGQPYYDAVQRWIDKGTCSEEDAKLILSEELKAKNPDPDVIEDIERILRAYQPDAPQPVGAESSPSQ